MYTKIWGYFVYTANIIHIDNDPVEEESNSL